MFVGHYGPSYALQRSAPQVPLWLLFLAVQFVDILWSIFVLLGVEHVRMVPGFTESNPMDLYYMPFTHSLTASAAWALLFGGAARLRWGPRAGLVAAAAVLSHWFIDLPVHVPDLPLYGNVHKVGFGLWNAKWVAFALESAVLLAGTAWYLRNHPARARLSRRVWIFSVIMLAVQLSTLLAPAEVTAQVFAVQALASYLLFAAAAYWVADRVVAPLGSATPD